MTPLLEFFSGFLPKIIARLAASLVYAALIVGVLLTFAGKPPDVLYVNVPDLSVEN
jgi:hypothetical protein